MKIKQVNLILNDSAMQDKECNFKLIKTKTQAPAWFRSFEVQINKRFDNLETRIDNLEARIDNLVNKNRLVE